MPDSYVIISIALEWHEAIKTRREQAFQIREPELRVREQENKPGTGELIITCETTDHKLFASLSAVVSEEWIDLRPWKAFWHFIMMCCSKPKKSLLIVPKNLIDVDQLFSVHMTV